MGKNLKLRKAQDELRRRIKDYEEACSKRVDHGKGMRRPGRMKVKK